MEARASPAAADADQVDAAAPGHPPHESGDYGAPEKGRRRSAGETPVVRRCDHQPARAAAEESPRRDEGRAREDRQTDRGENGTRTSPARADGDLSEAHRSSGWPPVGPHRAESRLSDPSVDVHESARQERGFESRGEPRTPSDR